MLFRLIQATSKKNALLAVQLKINRAHKSGLEEIVKKKKLIKIQFYSNEQNAMHHALLSSGNDCECIYNYKRVI